MTLSSTAVPQISGLRQGICVDYTNYCFGFHVHDDRDNAKYYMDRLSWNNNAAATASSPDLSGVSDFTSYKMKLAADNDATFGFSEK